MFEFLGLALFLGVKHSFDADHLVAVSNVLTRATNLKSSLKLGMSWAIGHMITATIITILLFTFKDSILPLILDKFETLVAFMLIGLGIWSLWSARVFHRHRHVHEGKKHEHLHVHLIAAKTDHSHRHIFGIGILHGLASNDELLILLTASLGVSSLFEMISGVAVFSLGVVLGMVAFSLIFTLPFLRIRGEALRRAVIGGVGGISILYGAMLLLGV
ncbi:MAG: sulfite exporter TauE/SafE family protein [Candidatus Micrarchaeota archaeon]